MIRLRVIHPLDDVAEEKLYREDLGSMRMSRTVQIPLMLLRGYMAAITALVAWRVLSGL